MPGGKAPAAMSGPGARSRPVGRPDVSKRSEFDLDKLGPGSRAAVARIMELTADGGWQAKRHIIETVSGDVTPSWVGGLFYHLANFGAVRLKPGYIRQTDLGRRWWAETR